MKTFKVFISEQKSEKQVQLNQPEVSASSDLNKDDLEKKKSSREMNQKRIRKIQKSMNKFVNGSSSYE